MPAGPIEDRMERLRRDLRARLPVPHLDFLQGLELWAEIGDYLFVHAGVRPGRRLEQQSRTDLVEIREPFLSHRRPLPWRVVHGHTVSAAPEIRAHRIGIDTGAYAGGPLSCAVLEGSLAKIISS